MHEGQDEKEKQAATTANDAGDNDEETAVNLQKYCWLHNRYLLSS